MKVFPTLATILGVTYAAPEARMGSMDMMRSNMGQQQQQQLMQPRMDMMRSNMGQQEQLMQPGMDMMSERKMSLKMSPMRTMYRDQAMGPNQYFLQDEFGNYAYAYANQNSEKMEKGDQNSVKGHYAYIMSNGQKRRVDYIADNQGFHIIRDDADMTSRFKRSVEPDLIQTKMTSFMDSSSLRDDSRDMYRMMSPNNMMYRNRMGMRNNQMSRNMGRDMYTMNNDMSSQMVNRNMMSQDMSTNMMNRNMMGQDMSSNNMMYRNMMDKDMSTNMMNRNMMGQDMSNNMVYSNMMDMSNNMRNKQMMGQDMMYSNMNMMNQGMDRMNAYANNDVMGQNRNVMSQRIEIEQIPSSTRFF